ISLTPAQVSLHLRNDWRRGNSPAPPVVDALPERQLLAVEVPSMARGGGGNTGLVVSLIFFVLATIVLGVTTYLGFYGQYEVTKKAKDEKGKAGLWEAKANWYRFQSDFYRAVLGEALPQPEATTLSTLMQQYTRQADHGDLVNKANDDNRADSTQTVD